MYQQKILTAWVPQAGSGVRERRLVLAGETIVGAIDLGFSIDERIHLVGVGREDISWSDFNSIDPLPGALENVLDRPIPESRFTPRHGLGHNGPNPVIRDLAIFHRQHRANRARGPRSRFLDAPG